jgi:hypothetical protein
VVYNKASTLGAPKENAGFLEKPSVHQSFRAPFLFSLAKSRIIRVRVLYTPVLWARYDNQNV